MVEIKLLSIDQIKEFVKIARKYDGDVNLSKGKIIVDGKYVDDIVAIDTSVGVIAELISDNEENINKFNYDLTKYMVEDF